MGSDMSRVHVSLVVKAKARVSINHESWFRLLLSRLRFECTAVLILYKLCENKMRKRKGQSHTCKRWAGPDNHIFLVCFLLSAHQTVSGELERMYSPDTNQAVGANKVAEI